MPLSQPNRRRRGAHASPLHLLYKPCTVRRCNSSCSSGVRAFASPVTCSRNATGPEGKNLICLVRSRSKHLQIIVSRCWSSIALQPSPRRGGIPAWLQPQSGLVWNEPTMGRARKLSSIPFRPIHGAAHSPILIFHFQYQIFILPNTVGEARRATETVTGGRGL